MKRHTTDSHEHACDQCGQPFECFSDWLRGDDGDGRPAPVRRCSVELAICEDCAIEATKDADDYARERADRQYESEREDRQGEPEHVR